MTVKWLSENRSFEPALRCITSAIIHLECCFQGQ